MARNEEKARGSLNRWTLASRTGTSLSASAAAASQHVRRPQLASECTSLPECEKWRRQLVEELNRKLLKLSSINVAERDQIMQLNDECNKKLRIIEHWERQIRALGGPDYRSGPSAVNAQGAGNQRYRYFGVAKDLPEVREILARQSESMAQVAVESIAKRRIDARLLDHEYFGLHDDDLVAAEALAEEPARKRALDEFLPPKRRAGGHEDDDEGEAVLWDEAWPVPDRSAVDAALLAHRKRMILEKYG
jgi:pre-mRNA-splicing factor ISY1